MTAAAVSRTAPASQGAVLSAAPERSAAADRAAGIEHFIFIVGRGQGSVEDYFDHAYETEAMREMAEAAGLQGAVIVNTCAVTAEAVADMFREPARSAGQAIEDAGLTDMPEAERFRAGCSIGSGIGGPPGIEHESIVLHEKGPSRVSPHFVHGRLINLITGQVTIKYGLMGPNHAVVTACSTGAHSIGDAARMIAMDDADVMLAGGAEGAICPIGIAGFAQARALSTAFNDQPERASRPYDRDRDGFVMGEGAAVLILETEEHAKARGAKIYAAVVGGGVTADSYHITANDPEGWGAARAVKLALDMADASPDDVTRPLSST